MSKRGAMMAAVRQQGAVAVPWTPAAIASLEAWGDYKDTGTVTVVNTDEISAWNDKAKVNHATQPSSTIRPRSTGSINGQSAAKFESGDWIKLTSSMPAGSGFTAVAVGRHTSATTRCSYFGYGDTLKTRIPDAQSGSTDINMSEIDANTSQTNRVFLFDGEASQTVANRGDLYTSMTTKSLFIFTSSLRPVALPLELCRGGGFLSASLIGDMGEWMFFSSVLSAADIARVQGYCAHRWNFVASLGGGHIYFPAPPTL